MLTGDNAGSKRAVWSNSAGRKLWRKPVLILKVKGSISAVNTSEKEVIHALFLLAGSLTGLPIIGAVEGFGSLVFSLVHIGLLLMGTIIGGVLAQFKEKKKTMKRITFVAGSFILIVVSGVWAQDGEVGFLYSFLQGTYKAIGRLPDSDKCYSGKVVLKSKGDRLQVLRTINGQEVEGVGRVDTATADKVKVLKVEFSQHGREYMATYLIDSDLDNYARLTGYLFLKKGRTKRPGLEALFIDHQALKEK